MTASAHARLLVIGIWTEAWDDGVFEWKPLTLKARLFPVDTVNVTDLLAELVTLGFVKQFEAGKPYGAIRNFQKYQRPKKPNSSGVLPNDLYDYVGLVPHQFPTSSEKSPQMEDGGWSEGEGENKDAASAASSASAPALDLNEAERRCREASGSDALGSFGPIAELLLRLESPVDLDLDALPVIRARPAGAHGIKSWRYYAPIIAEAAGKRIAKPITFGPPKVFVKVGTPEWDARLAAGHKASLCKFYPEFKAEGWFFPAPSQSDQWEGRAVA